MNGGSGSGNGSIQPRGKGQRQRGLNRYEVTILPSKKSHNAKTPKFPPNPNCHPNPLLPPHPTTTHKPNPSSNSNSISPTHSNPSNPGSPTPPPPCSFNGVTCDSVTVTSLRLDDLSLSGLLSLGNNNFSGEVPPDLTRCANLRSLNLSTNFLTGPIPDLSALSELRVLDLSTNSFLGQAPMWVFRLTSLSTLGLRENGFDDWVVPDEIGNLKNLTWLFLGECNLFGEIPNSILELKLLESLDFSRNKLSGEFPKAITTLLPPEDGNLKHLKVFHLYMNNFFGELQKGFGDMAHLIGFSIYQNGFTGEFPANFGRFSPLNSIDILEIFFSGEFPKYLCHGNNLEKLLALDNGFTGEFPDYSECKGLVRLRVSVNRLSGKVLDKTWGLPNAEIIDLADNDFEGCVSKEIGISTSLIQLHLQNNRFSGALPAEPGKLPLLQNVFAFNNSFSGEIPLEMGNLDQLSTFHLEGNSLTGPLPSELGKCGRLVDLDVMENSLTGEIPASISTLFSLNSLNLSHNELSGEIPEGLLSLKLSSIDFSNNQLIGMVPLGLLMVAGDGAFWGNPGLCIDQYYKNKSNSELGICHHSYGHKEGEVLVVVLVVVVIVSVLVFVSYRSFKCHRTNKYDNLEEGLGKDSNWKLQSFHPAEFDVDEICRLEENLIGSRGTGKVYRMDLKNGGVVAVKQLIKRSEVKVVATEIDILGEDQAQEHIEALCMSDERGLSFPELAYSTMVTEKSDVYSFGVVLLELVTGKGPIEPDYGDGKDIVYWVSTNFSKQGLAEILDQNLSSQAEEDMIKVLKVAILCTAKLPSVRPTMREVVNMLVGADPSAPPTPADGKNIYATLDLK
ncbi:Receptor-like protein kinase HAIKU2 [Acorus calamus]|uniref:Receptor-like protein kinase HAIKU2 n=1 Tax=Acorus calamus TaxID=4465 RepID=A0AAV9FHN7_ACOCL|nr:Receptor-like protein kinase HAIKU2 [Acorus calamus]